MKDKEKTKKQLVNELVGARSRIAELEAAETEHQEAEEALRTSEERYRTLAESSPDCIKLLDLEGTIIECNTAAVQCFEQKSKEDFIGKKLIPFFPEEYQPDLVEALDGVRQGQEARLQLQTRASTGALMYWDITINPIRDEADQVISILFAGRDITERVQAEEEFRSLKELHENVVHSIQDGLVAIDLEFRITYWNKAMEKINGYKAEEVLGKIATDLFPFLREQGVHRFFRAAMEGQVVELTNVLYKTPKGKTVYTNKRFFPLRDQAGEITGALAIVEDLTELRHLEEKLASLQDEIEQRKLVEIAKGILMRVMDVPEPKSYLILQKKSQDENLKMVEVAKQVIECFGSPEERKKFS